MSTGATEGPELPDALHERIKRLCADGDELANAADFYSAVSTYEEALALLPEPREQWEAATWIYTAIADAYFLAGDFESAWEPLRAVMHCPDALGNPLIRLRRGQVYYELGDEHMATQELASAYMLCDIDIFAQEDPKYAEFILPKLDPPAVDQ